MDYYVSNYKLYFDGMEYYLNCIVSIIKSEHILK